MSGLTIARLDVLAEIGTVADDAADLDQSERLNMFHGLARLVGTEGSTRETRLALAAYALAIVEADDTAVTA